VQGIVHDVSENGVKVEMDMAPAAGVVTVKLPGFPSFSGEVRWRGGRYIGIEFLNPIPTAFLNLWVESHGSSSGG
jgi:PilZ domain